jgi:astacin
MAIQTAALAQSQTAHAGADDERSAVVLGPSTGLLLMAPLVVATEPAAPDQAAGEAGRMFSLAPLPDSSTGDVRLLRFSALGASAYRFYFEGVALPRGARMFLYGLDSGGRVTTVFGPYEQSGPLAEGTFRSRVITGAEAVVEIQGTENGPWPFRIPRVAAIDAGLLSEMVASGNPDLIETPDQRTPPRAERIELEINGKPVTAQIIGGDVVVEGDIVVGSANEMLIASGKASKDSRRLAVMRTESSGRWPAGVIPFAIDSGLIGDPRITAALQTWTNIMSGVLSFVPRTNEPDFIRFSSTSSNVCSSGVGRTSGARTILLGSVCSTGNVRHEIGHALGFYHEQSREDRDGFVRIIWDNIDSDDEHNFEKAAGDANTDIGRYDFGSIMHYPLNAFSTNGQNTIEPLVPVPAGITVGQRVAPSDGDVSALKSRYGVTLSPAVVNVPSAGGTFSVRVSTQDDRFWTAHDDANWVSVVSGGSGQGNGVVQFSVASNVLVTHPGVASLIGPTNVGFTPPPRTANLHIGLAPFAISATVKIIQASPDCTYTVSPSKILAGSEAGTYTVNVTTPSHCTWGTSEALQWVQLSPAYGQGSRTVSVSLSPNMNTNINKPVSAPKRTGTIVVAGKTITIEQQGGCALCFE